ncbi:MAG TPA: hypothetical protein VFU72_12360 [Nitrolancea sp.]|nr:hypothetical protein [Nitrolancea sp.]
MFGLRVDSAVSLPIPALGDADDSRPDVRIVWEDRAAAPAGQPRAETRCYCPFHAGRVVMRVYREDKHSWIWHEGAGTSRVADDGRTITLTAGTDVIDERVRGLILAGLGSMFVLHHRGVPCLHAAAVLLDGCAVAFLGAKGQGKSTLVSGLLRRQGTLLTDDILPLQHEPEGISGLPSLPIMKLWDGSVTHALGVTDDLPVLTQNLDKRLFTLDERFTFATEPVRLRAIYLLDRYDPLTAGEPGITVEPVARREALMTLLAQTPLRPYLTPEELAGLLPLYQSLLLQAPLRRLRYPSGFAYQDTVYARLRADLAAAPGESDQTERLAPR